MLEIDKGFISRTLKILLFSLSIMILTIAITYSININMKEVIKSIDNGIPGSVKESSGLGSVFKYIVNNGLVVPLQMFILSLIPIQFLYLFNLIYSSILPGIVIGIAIKIDIYKATSIILSIIPHTLLEILGFCIFASVLFQLKKSIRSKIKEVFKKNSSERISVVKSLSNTVKIYIFAVVPVITLAAFCEEYLREFLYSLLTST
ncbi:stage II sporulation protein M [Staphylococcus ureilyticus]|uniref:stage II sporulation protein M n=1 Tax=Staphylococcus ureilyticus TaxID=94138 RepID=UPI0021D155A9|nr:stage II sporulation protein M [Staphylococcus ureilyticus]UXS59856.1 stage II sporulation protein M [Staphylococcus ureilyticus]